MKYHLEEAVVCIVGLGYVGLPLAEAFSKSLKVMGFDTDTEKVNQLRDRQSAISGRQSEYRTDSSGLTRPETHLTFTTNPKDISKADFIIICVPTPVTKSKEPDLAHFHFRQVAAT